MNNKISGWLMLLLLPAGTVLAQDEDISFKSTELAPGLYMLEGQGGFAGGNLGLSTGDDGVVLVDDGIGPLAQMTIQAVTKLTGKPVDFVINTHVHDDHIGGNAALHAAGARIVAHENIRRRLVGGNGGENGSTADSLPEITFSESVTFHLNGLEAFVFHVAEAHTDGDAVIWFREADVVHAGDVLFNGLFPFIDLDSGGSVSGYIAAQEDILSLIGPRTRIIPGHGPPAGAEDLRKARDMLVDSRRLVKELVDAGLSEEEILARNPLEPYEGWGWDFITLEVMTRTLYRDLTSN